MTNKTKFLKFGIAVILGTGAAGILYAQLNIPTNIDNAVMTIRQINITEEGKDTTPKVIIDGNPGNDNFLKVEWSILMWTITGASNQINKVAWDRSSVLWWQANDVNWNGSVIAWWKINKVVWDTSTNIWWYQNNINWNHNTILWWHSNTVTWSYSTIAGWQSNNINTNNSFAAGKNTQVNNQWTFVWSDNYIMNSPAIFSSFRDYTFLIRARNWVGINTWNTTTWYALTLQGSWIVYGNMVSNWYYYKEITAADEAYELTLSQWQDAVQTWNIYYNSGYVGIWLNNPAAQLHVNGAVRLQWLTSLSESTALMIDLNGNLSTRELGTSAFVWYTAPVTSVAGRVWAIILAKSDVWLLNVDNTSDLNKPISTATQNALDDKAPLSSPWFIGIPTAPTAAAATNNTQIATTAFVKSQWFISTAPVTSVAGKLWDVTLERWDVWLSNVNNTSDLDKPISTATQTALNLKANLDSPSLSWIPTAPTAVVSTNNTQIATTAFVKSQWFITTAPVTSVAGKVWAVTLAKSDVWLSNVDDIQQIPLSYLDITTTLWTSNIKVPTQNAVKTYVDTNLAPKANLDSPALTWIPTAPTAALSTSNTQLATTAFVKTQWYLTSAPVTSVAGKVWVVSLVKSDVWLWNVNNTTDLAKPISTATQAALNTKLSNKICNLSFSFDKSTAGAVVAGKRQNWFHSNYFAAPATIYVREIVSADWGNSNGIVNDCYWKNIELCYPTWAGSSYWLVWGYHDMYVHSVIDNDIWDPQVSFFWWMSAAQWANNTDLGTVAGIQYASRITAWFSCIYK